MESTYSDPNFVAREQTKISFGAKWSKNPRLLFSLEEMERSGTLDWIVRRNGFADLEEFRIWISSKQSILDAGCGNGRITSILALLSSTDARVVGIDINPEVAMTNLQGEAGVQIQAADLLSDLSHLGSFDLIYCQEVLHHTANPRQAFISLSQLLRDEGEIAIYVYKVKAPVREFVDDFVRARVEHLSYEEVAAEMAAITEIGRVLSSLGSRITVPDVPTLGITAGEYDVQRFFYHFFMKCYWNDELDSESNIAINYDWYHPSLCSRHTLDEVREWFSACGLTIEHEEVDHYGITLRGRRHLMT